MLFVDNLNYHEIIASNPHLSNYGYHQSQRYKEWSAFSIFEPSGGFTNMPNWWHNYSAPKIGQPGKPKAKLMWFGWVIMSPGKESFNLSHILLTQMSHVDYEELCCLDVVGLVRYPNKSPIKHLPRVQRATCAWQRGLEWEERSPPCIAK